MKNKLELAKGLKDIGVPLSWILKNILGFSSDTVVEIMKLKKMEENNINCYQEPLPKDYLAKLYGERYKNLFQK